MFVAAKVSGHHWGQFNLARLVHGIEVLEEVLATPANHRVRHGTEARCLDLDCGQMLNVWDRRFGTFQREDEETTFSVVKQMEWHRILDGEPWSTRVLWSDTRRALC
jgi:sterol desaturase/sphingolipid hydroxylase (fatty acid hydroxylase superfamily)